MIIRWLLCLAVLTAGAVLIGYRGGTAGFMLFWTMLLIPVSAILYRRIIANRLRAHFTVGSHTVLRGESVSCMLTLTNDSILPISDIRVRLTSGKVRFLDIDREQHYFLMPGETKVLELQLACFHCGETTVGAEQIDAGDLFALTERRLSAVRTINILPRTQHLQDLIIAPVRQVDRQNISRTYFGDTMPDGQLKPYIPGEDVRRIHWKASVLQGKPILRNMVPEPKTEIVLLPDARADLPGGEARWLAEDSVIEGTLAIVDYFLRSNIISRVIADEQRVVNVFTPSHYQKLYEMCASGFFIGTDRPDRMMERDMSSTAGRRSYIILTWEMDEAFIRRCSDCLDVGAEVTVVYIGDDTETRSLAAVDRRIAFYQVTGQRDIFAVLSGTKTMEGVAE